MALLGLFLAVPAADPTVLVVRLATARYADREAASAALKALGTGALPALRAAAGAGEPEVRARAGGLRARIESGLLRRASTLRIAAADCPLDEVTEAVRRQGANRLAWHPRASEPPRVTLRAPEPVPFWEAVDVREPSPRSLTRTPAAGRRSAGQGGSRGDSRPPWS